MNTTRVNCDGCRYDLGGGCCSINMEPECREGGGFELFENRDCRCSEDGCFLAFDDENEDT